MQKFSEKLLNKVGASKSSKIMWLKSYDRYGDKVHYFFIPHNGKKDFLVKSLKKGEVVHLEQFAEIIAFGKGYETHPETKARLLAEYNYQAEF